MNGVNIMKDRLKHLKWNHVRSVAERMFRPVMDFQEQTVDPDSHSGATEGMDLGPVT